MSLLDDLLSKIKPPQTTRDIPPNLKNIVQSSALRSANRRRFVLLSVLFAFAVLAGVFLVYLINTLSEKPAGTMNTAPQRMVIAPAHTQTAPDKVLPAAQGEDPEILHMKKADAALFRGDAGEFSGDKEKPAEPVQPSGPGKKLVRDGGDVLPVLEQVIVKKKAPVAQASAKDESALNLSLLH